MSLGSGKSELFTGNLMGCLGNVGEKMGESEVGLVNQ